jgi:hypothetical protein
MASRQLRNSCKDFLAAYLVHAIQELKAGEMVDSGVDPEVLRALDGLTGDQLFKVVERYFLRTHPSQFIRIDTEAMAKLVIAQGASAREEALIDEFILRGATKDMMRDFFGLRSTQVSERRKALNTHSNRGRKARITDEERDRIFDSWQSIRLSDKRERLICVARETGIPLFKILVVVEEIEAFSRKNTPRRKHHNYQTQEAANG